MPADFNRIVYFLRVCECGSISKAAESLYITPQALNRQIRVLEEELGEPLFVRNTRRLSISTFGTFFRNQMQPVYRMYQAAQRQVAEYLGTANPSLRIGFFQGIPKRQAIQPVIAEIVEQLPDVQIELGSAEMDEVYADLFGKKTDIAITYVNPIDDIGELVEIPLVTLSCSVVVSVLHPWAEKDSITIDDMETYPVLFLNRANGPDKVGFYGNMKAGSYHFAASYNAMLAQLGLGKHYGVFPVVFENLAEMGLKSFKLPAGCEAEFRLSLVYRQDSPYAEFFSSLDHLRDTFEETIAAKLES